MYNISYFKIGLRFVILLAIIVATMLWIHVRNFQSCQYFYNIHFKTSIAGLRKGDPVLYKGISAGRVEEVALHPEDLNTVVVKICMMPGFPIKEDANATVETRSIAGGSILALTGGSIEAPLLVSKDKNHPPIIHAKISTIEQLTTVLPGVLDNIEKFVGELTPRKDDFKDLVNNLKEITAQFAKISPEDMKEVVRLVKTNLKQFSTIQDKLIHIIDANQSGVSLFFSAGIKNLNLFLSQGAETMTAVRKLVESIERSPSRFFHNDPSRGIRVR